MVSNPPLTSPKCSIFYSVLSLSTDPSCSHSLNPPVSTAGPPSLRRSSSTASPPLRRSKPTSSFPVKTTTPHGRRQRDQPVYSLGVQSASTPKIK